MNSEKRCNCSGDAIGSFAFGFFLGGLLIFILKLFGLCLPSVDQIREEWPEGVNENRE